MLRGGGSSVTVFLVLSVSEVLAAMLPQGLLLNSQGAYLSGNRIGGRRHSLKACRLSGIPSLMHLRHLPHFRGRIGLFSRFALAPLV